MKIGKRIQARREAIGLSQDDLAKAMGYKDRSTISKIESEVNDIPQAKIIEFARALQTTAAYLMGMTDNPTPHTSMLGLVSENNNMFAASAFLKNSENYQVSPNPTVVGSKWIPVLGSVVAGIPIEATEEIIGWEEINAKTTLQAEHFALIIKGDSMEPLLIPGDVVIVRQQPTAENGDIVVTTVNGDEASVRRIKTRADGLMLIANNPSYDPVYYTNKEINALPVRILGKVIESRRSF